MVRSRRLLLLALSLAACSSNVGTKPEPSKTLATIPPGPVSSAPTSPVASSAPSGAAQRGSPALPPSLPEERVAFALAAEGRAPVLSSNARPLVHLDPLRGALFLCAGARIAALGPGGFAAVPPLEKAVPKGWSVARLFGQWPTDAFAQLNPGQGTDDPSRALYRMSERGMRRLHSVTPYTDYLGAWYGATGQVGAVVYIYQDGSLSTWIEPQGGTKTGVPRLSQQDGKEPRLSVYDMASFPSGHLFLFGADGSADELPSAIERFDPGAQASTFERLPLPLGANGRIKNAAMGAFAPTEVWIAGLLGRASEQPDQPYLTRWDGARWTFEDMPAPSFVPYGRSRIVAVTPGELWVGWESSDGRIELMHRTPPGRWSRALLPAPPPDFPPGPRILLELRAYEQELWMSIASRDAKERFAVYRTRPSPGVLRVDALSP